MAQYVSYASNPNTMVYNSGTVYGYGWHRRPGMVASGSLTFTRNSESDPTVHIQGTIGNEQAVGSSSSPNRYGYPVSYAIYCGSNRIASGVIFDYSTSNYDHNEHTVNINTSCTLTNNTDSIDVLYYCNEGNVEGNCSATIHDGAESVAVPYETVFSLPAGALPYNPYTPPTTYIVTPKELMNYNKTYGNGSDGPTYSISGGTGIIDWMCLNVISPSTTTWDFGVYKENGVLTPAGTTVENNTIHKETILSADRPNKTNTAQGVVSFKPSNYSCTSGGKYKMAIYFSDNRKEWVSGDNKVFYTYTEPTIDTPIFSGGTTTGNKFSPQNRNARLTWSQNDRAYPNGPESAFTTQIKGKETISNKTISTFKFSDEESNNKTYCDRLFGERSTWVGPSITKTITVTRQNPTTGFDGDDASKTITVTLQLQPNEAMSDSTYKILKPGTSGTPDTEITSVVRDKTIDINTYPTIKLQWSYPYDNMGAGQISGYEIRIYKDSDRTQQVGNSINVPTTDYDPVKSGVIDVATQLARNVKNYVKIVPYYIDSQNNTRYGNNPLLGVLFAPYAGLPAPTIDYPINNSTWHNKNFRVLFRPPVDPDYASLSNAEKAAYRYADVEVNINNTAYKFSEHPEIFNETQLYHVNHRDSSGSTSINYIVANPSLVSGFSDTSSYVIKVRVAKTVSGTPTWSAYSTVTLKKSAITDNTYTVGDNITATHFNKIRNYCVQLRNVYPIRSLYPDNVTVSAGTAINHNRYQAIWNNVAGIQQDVNNYAKFDGTRQNVKFNQSIIGLSSTYHNEAISDEVITATKNSVVDRTILLFNGAPWGHVDESKTVGFKVSANLVIKRPTPNSTRVNITGNINIVTTLPLTYTLNDTSGTKGIGAYLNVGGVNVPLTPYAYNILAASVNSVIWNRNVALTGNNGVNFTSGNLQVVLNYQFYNPVNQHTTLYTINVGPTVAASAVPYDSTWTPDRAPYDSHGRNYLKIIFDDMQKLY